ncbi:hypothetical protein ACLOJK_001842 [Asimina triloba]
MDTVKATEEQASFDRRPPSFPFSLLPCCEAKQNLLSSDFFDLIRFSITTTMPSKLQKAIAAVKDQTSISIAKVYGNIYSNLDVAILKATTHEEVPVVERHVKEVVCLTVSSHTYAAACVQCLSRRITRTRNWIVALKSLTLIFRILQEGDSHFPRAAAHAMKHGMRLLNLSAFRDDSNSSPWDYTAFVRTFALYLDDRLDCALHGKLRSSSSSSPNSCPLQHHHIRDMKPAVLLDKMAYWQRLLDRALATRPTGSAKTNRLVQTTLYSIVRESFDLYRDISDGLKFLLDNFFHLQHRSCVEAFHICTKATKQFDELADFYTLCKSLGIGWKSEYPSVQKISDQLLDTLQEFLKDHHTSFHAAPGPGKPREAQKLLALPPPSAKRSPGSQLSEESSSYQDCKAGSEEGSESSSPETKETNKSAVSWSDKMGVEQTKMRRGASASCGNLALLPFDQVKDDRNIPKVSSCTALFQEQQRQRQLRELPPTTTSSSSSFGGVPVEWEAVLAESARSKSGPLGYSSKADRALKTDPSSTHSNPQDYSNYSNPFLNGSDSSSFFLSLTLPLPTFSAKGPELAMPPEEDPFSSLYCTPQPPVERPLTGVRALSFDSAEDRNFYFAAAQQRPLRN